MPLLRLDCLPRRDIRPRSLDRRLDCGAISAGLGPRPGGDDDIASVLPSFGAFAPFLVLPSRPAGWPVYKCVGSAPAAANPNNSPPRWKMTAAIQNFFSPLATNFESPRCFFSFFFWTTFSPLREKAVQAFAQAPWEVEVRWFRPALTFVWFLCVRVVFWREIHRASFFFP